MPAPNSTSRPSRRDFTRRLVLAGPLALAAGESSAQEPAKNPAEPLLQLLSARFGEHLSKQQLGELAKTLVRQQFAAEFLKRGKLRNSDEPAFAFRADLP